MYAEMAFTWPRFSATSITTTGTIRDIASKLKVGATKVGEADPVGALTTRVKSTLPVSAATR